LSGLAAGLLAVLVATAAVAGNDDEVAEAKAHFQAGVALLKAENYAGAAVEFEASVALFPTANVLFNLANCYQALHRYSDALATFARLEEEFGDDLKPTMRDAIERHQHEIREIVAQLTIRVDPDSARVEVGNDVEARGPVVGPIVLSPGEYEVRVTLDGYEEATLRVKLVAKSREERSVKLSPAPAALAVRTDQRDAAVIVDGETVGHTPLAGPIELTHGEHSVVVSKQGFETAERSVVLGPGESFTLDLTMAAVPGTGPAPDPPPADAGEPSALFWTGLGLTAAAGVTAGVFWGLAGREHDEFSRLDEQIASGEIQPGDPEVADRDAAADDGRLYSGLALGFGIGAGVLAVATGVVLALDLKGDDEDPPPVEVSAAPGGVRLTF
jgi:hypothetical protein